MTAEPAQRVGGGRGLGNFVLGTLLVLGGIALLVGFRVFLFQPLTCRAGR
jgi:hypothetical protein